MDKVFLLGNIQFPSDTNSIFPQNPLECLLVSQFTPKAGFGCCVFEFLYRYFSIGLVEDSFHNYFHYNCSSRYFLERIPAFLQKGADRKIPYAESDTNCSADAKFVKFFHEFFLWGFSDIQQLALELQMSVGWNRSLVPLVPIGFVGRDLNGSLSADLHALCGSNECENAD